ncbi:hypothetical protein [Amycolatopsis anabasis]|uniref:hypothetical protein n=1 Tax=Amycolatopsis anabasis TaxID=1840409 RepID=UPI00131D7344|nr:hypothetical protein [Amycolatopsis anabasis]
MIERDLRRRCADAVRDLVFPQPFSAKKLCASVARQRGRPLYLHQFSADWVGGENLCGVWIGTDVADHIFFEQQTSPFHQEHIILHELGHMIFEHAMPELLDQFDPTVFDDGANLAHVQNALLRASYTTQQEQEAELVASLILTRAGWDRTSSPRGETRAVRAALGLDE